MIKSNEQGFSWSIPETRRADGSYFVYDLGCETIGYPLLELTVDQPTEILVGFGEHLEDLRVRSSCGNRNFCFRYVAKPGNNVFFHPFRRIGLRYMQLHIYTTAGHIGQVSIRPTRYPMTPKKIPVTDSLHRQIWRVAANTLDLCMQDYYCDCIWREQSMYAYDGRMEMLATYYGFDAPEFARESLRICAEQLREDNLLEMCAPGTEPSNVPSYSAVYMKGVWEYTQFTNDISLATEVFHVLKTIADGFIKRISSLDLIPIYPGYWHFHEWQSGLDGKDHPTDKQYQLTDNDYDLPTNAYIAEGLHCFAQICNQLYPELSVNYEEASQRIKTALHKHFYRTAYHGYATRISDPTPRHDLTQGLMLCFNAVPVSCRPEVERTVLSKSLLPATLGLSVYVYDGLLINPSNSDFVKNEIENRWGMMLKKGCDTFWETEQGASAFGGAGALCQGWSSIPLYLFGKYKL